MPNPLPPHFFREDSSGYLYDCRQVNWCASQPVRTNYRRHHATIRTCSDLLATLRAGQYAWPGGYPLYFLTSDGGALRFETVLAELANIVDSIRSNADDGWRVVACAVNWEDPDLHDDHTGESIESAYSEPMEI